MDNGLPHLRTSLGRGPALRLAQASPPPQRLVEVPPQAPVAAPRLSFWQFTLRAVPIIVAIASTAVLGYFLLSERWQPNAQPQQPPQTAQIQQQWVQAQQPQPQAQVQQPQVQPPQAQAQPQVQEPDPPVPNPLPQVPSDDKLLILINSALVALNQANATGNYTVLRDMAAPGFKRANSPERLYQVFSNLRSRNLDLSPILLYQPKLYQRPVMNNKGMLRIAGFFPTLPERVNFDLIFQPVQGRWRLYGIAANTQPAPRPQPPFQAEAPAPTETSPAKPAAAQAAKPAAPSKKPAEKPKAAETVAKPQVDVRDRIDNPPPAAPAPAEKPKDKSIWNPFGSR